MLEITVQGRVQGVCFRYFVKQEANKLNIKGYVRNVDDDKVEIVAEGEESALKELINLSKKGPPMAHVIKQNINYFNYQGNFKDFRITH